MHDIGSQAQIPVVKDGSKEGPIPSVWRPAFCDIVSALVRGDFKLGAGIAGVLPVSDDTAEHMASYAKDYGETLVELPEETWKSSVCVWTGHRWDALVDLWAAIATVGRLIRRRVRGVDAEVAWPQQQLPSARAAFRSIWP